jgi:hypothetical protein
MSFPREFELLVAGEWKPAFILGEHGALSNAAFMMGRHEDAVEDEQRRSVWVRTKLRWIDDQQLEVMGNGFEPSYHVQPSMTQWRRSALSCVNPYIHSQIRVIAETDQEELQLMHNISQSMRNYMFAVVSTALDNAQREGLTTIHARHVQPNLQIGQCRETCVLIDDIPPPPV